MTDGYAKYSDIEALRVKMRELEERIRKLEVILKTKDKPLLK